jgi:hypothetical protein
VGGLQTFECGGLGHKPLKETNNFSYWEMILINGS